MSTKPSLASILSAFCWWTACAVLTAFALFGSFASETFWGFLSGGVAAALCAPPVQNQLRERLGMTLTPRLFKVAAFVLVVSSLVLMGAGTLALEDAANQKKAEARLQARADAEAKFQAGKAAAVASITAKRNAGRYEDALAEIARNAALSSDPVLKQLKASVEAAALEAEAAACMASLSERQAQYASLFQQAKFDEAAEALKRCAAATGSPELKEQVTAALAQPFVQILDSKTATLPEKQSALGELGKVSAPKAQAYGRAVRDLEVKEAERVAKAERKRKKSEGVTLGMSEEDVLASSWGAPESVNRTTNAYGVREQWVYSGHRGYLYFHNGVLVTIQN